MKKNLSIILILTVLFTLNIFATGTKENKILDVKVLTTQVNLIPNMVYSQPDMMMGQGQVSMDILRPSINKPVPAVIYITGGGFLGSPKETYIQQRIAIAEAGYVVASIEYRVAPLSTFPAALEDAKSAVRYLRANAKKYGIDPNNIAVMGESAGGYLSAMVGTTNGMKDFDKGDFLEYSSDVQAAIDIYGLSDLTKVGDDFPKDVQATHKTEAAPEAMWVNGVPIFGKGGTILSDLAKTEAANPIKYISKNTPPFLLMHGDKDTLVSPSQTQILHDALISKGIDSTRYIVKGATHGGEYWNQKEVTNLIISFLDKNLKK